MYRCSNKDGFTLVELSIVLIIIGLIISGVLAGKDLIRQSELRGVVSELYQYQNIWVKFSNQYGAFPGDITNATTFFPSCVDVGGNLCNGNGAGTVDNNEIYRAWQHIDLAGYTEGGYTGLNAGLTGVPGENCPKSKVKDACWIYIMEWDIYTSWTTDATMANYLLIGKKRAGFPITSTFTPLETQQFDLKLDDGKPGQGRLWAFNSTAGCVTSATNATAEYSVSSDAILCIFAYDPRE